MDYDDMDRELEKQEKKAASFDFDKCARMLLRGPESGKKPEPQQSRVEWESKGWRPGR